MTSRPWTPPLARRRFITITAAAAGLALIPIRGARPAVTVADDAQRQLRIWRGVALGADASLQIHHPDPIAADRLIELCVAEVARLEKIFSLYRQNSAICRLNRDGFLDGPPIELVQLLGQSHQFSRISGGMFDATVQPLWDLYASHFANPKADPAGPPSTALKATLKRVSFEAIELDADRISFARPQMAITLNGIAQGYITDCVVDLLRSHGVNHTLVDMGELRAIGCRPTGGPWIVGLEDPTRQGEVAERLTIDNLAVATSGGYGTPIDPLGRFNHIFDPTNGRTSWRYLSVSVVAPLAVTADALSTAFSLIPLERTEKIVKHLDIEAHFVLPNGTRIVQTRGVT